MTRKIKDKKEDRIRIRNTVANINHKNIGFEFLSNFRVFGHCKNAYCLQPNNEILCHWQCKNGNTMLAWSMCECSLGYHRPKVKECR